MRRVVEAMEQVLTTAPLALLQQAVAAPTGAGAIATLVAHLPEANPRLAAADPEAAAVARAAQAKRRLLESAATFSTAEVAQLLGITEEGIRKRRLGRKLLAVEYAGDFRFPAWQFREAGVLPGLEAVLAAVPVDNPWVQLELLTTPVSEYGGKSVVQLLQTGAVPDAVAVVAAYGEHGA